MDIGGIFRLKLLWKGLQREKVVIIANFSFSLVQKGWEVRDRRKKVPMNFLVFVFFRLSGKLESIESD